MKKLNLLLLSTSFIISVEYYAFTENSNNTNEPVAATSATSNPTSTSPALRDIPKNTPISKADLNRWKGMRGTVNKEYNDARNSKIKAHLSKLTSPLTGGKEEKEAEYKEASVHFKIAKDNKEFNRKNRVFQEVGLARQKNRTSSIRSEIAYRKLFKDHNNGQNVGVLQEVTDAAGRAKGFSKITEGATGLAIGLGGAVESGYKSASKKASSLKSRLSKSQKNEQAQTPDSVN